MVLPLMKSTVSYAKLLGLNLYSHKDMPRWFVNTMQPDGCVETSHLGDFLLRVQVAIGKGTGSRQMITLEQGIQKHRN